MKPNSFYVALQHYVLLSKCHRNEEESALCFISLLYYSEAICDVTKGSDTSLMPGMTVPSSETTFSLSFERAS